MRSDDAMRAVAALAASQHGAYSRRQAAGYGVTKDMIATRKRRGACTEPVPGVILQAGVPMTFKTRLSIATLAGGGAAGSHRAAGMIHEFDGQDTAPVEVLVVRGRYPAIDGVIVHRTKLLGPADITQVDGITVTTAARTLCDLGAVSTQDAVEQALDGFLRRGGSERWVRDTLARVDRPGPSGTAVLKRILEDPRRMGQIPQTWFERIVQRALAADDIPEVVLQYPVHDAAGRLVAVLDLAIPAWRIGLEAHSAEWHDRPGRVWRDMERDNRLKALGFDIVYVTYGLARRPDEVLDIVRRIRAQRQAG